MRNGRAAMMRLFGGLLALLMLLVSALPSAYAQAPAAALNVPAILQAETLTPLPGQRVVLAFRMEPKPGWHGYWVNGGDAGVGMQLKWTLPPGVTAGELRYPVPKPLMISGLMNYVYESPYALLADLRVDPTVPSGTSLRIKVRADWLACTDRICVPEGDDLAIEMAVGRGTITAANRAVFDRYRAALPVPLDRRGTYSFSGAKAKKFAEIAVPFAAAAALDRPYFFALSEDVIDYPVPQTARRSGDFVVIRVGVRDDAGTAGSLLLSGVLRYGEGQGLVVNAVPGLVPAGGKPVPALGQGSEMAFGENALNFGLVLGLSLLGGLILNLMPCVFPILGLKAVSLAKMGGDGRAAKRDALAYTGGVVLSTLALGAAMLALRAAGEQVGWAFQLQEPRIVLLLLLLMVSITLNLVGAFELATVNIGDGLARKQGAAGSFWTGVLAAIVATPCTGPFMAAALGAALVLPAALALIVFAALGLGLALPYLAIGFIPRVRAMLPKPGPWLDRFRRLMAIPMALTAAALLWLLWRLSGQFGLVLGMTASATVAVMLLFAGNAQRRGGMLPPMMAATVLALAAIAALSLPREAIRHSADASKKLVQTEPFTPALLAKYRAAGVPVFAYFTADWCVTCKVNEAAAIQRAEVAAAFKAANVKVLEGDFTRRDPELARTLAAHGRSGVPLYLYYASRAEPKILPQILTANMLVDLASAAR
jgi:DsbC/DsbD-like thiol-disulfide interchange protein/cytochrome c biogenesis protein CcdA